MNVADNEISHEFILQAGLTYHFNKEMKFIMESQHKILVRFFIISSKMSKSSKYLVDLLQADNIINLLFESLKPSCELVDYSIKILSRMFESDIISNKITKNKISLEKFTEDSKITLKYFFENKKKDEYANICIMLNKFLKKYPNLISEGKDIIATTSTF